jgi:hypothetical protein
VAPGGPCLNCGTALLGPWCYACGQAASDTHRHAHHLIAETFESFFHADGRLWRTLPRLVAAPGALTRDFLAGKRASQIPPLRLFLVALFILFLAGSWSKGGHALTEIPAPSAADKAEIAKAGFDFGLVSQWSMPAADWLRPRVALAVENPQRLIDAMRARAHDFAFLMLPLSAFILALIFLFRRGFVLFDHFVFSMHSLAFQGFLLSAMIVGNMLSDVFTWLLMASPVHLYAHMRGTYGTGKLGTLIRMLVLGTASSVAFCLLLAALLLVGLEGLRA